MTTRQEQPARPSRAAVDVVTALSADDCVMALRDAARRCEQPLLVRSDDGRVVIDLVAQVVPRGQRPLLWLVRFEGVLTPVGVGTHVQGVVVRNRALEGVLVVLGIATVAFCVTGVGLSMPFVAALSALLLALFVAFYALYQRRLYRQSRVFLRWLHDCLIIPQGWAGQSLP